MLSSVSARAVSTSAMIEARKASSSAAPICFSLFLCVTLIQNSPDPRYPASGQRVAALDGYADIHSVLCRRVDLILKTVCNALNNRVRAILPNGGSVNGLFVTSTIDVPPAGMSRVTLTYARVGWLSASSARKA